MANIPPILKPDAKAVVFTAIGFLVVPKVLNAVKR